jgi:uncharacterized membrane protein
VFFRDRVLFRVPKVISIFITFHLVCLGWIFFRAQSFETIMIVLRNLTNFELPFYLTTPDVLLAIAAGFMSHLMGASTSLQRMWNDSFFGFKSCWYAFVIVAVFFMTRTSANFIYFQF